MEICTKPTRSRHIGTVKIVSYIHEIRVLLIEAVSQPQNRFLKRKMVWAHARVGFGRPSSTRAGSSKLFLASFRCRPKQLTHKHKDYTRILRF